MTVIAFEPRTPEWRKSELDALLGVLSPVFSLRGASGWEVAHTDAGDPQFYLLGPKPDQECILCVSRVGHTYVVNDNEGQHLTEISNIELLSSHVQGFLKRHAGRSLAKLMLVWCAAKQAFQDKVEPLIAETEELLVHFAPQLAALA
jgi:hypothetical protein